MHLAADVPKKVEKKRQAKTSLLKIRSTPIALPAPRPRLLISCALYFSIKNLSFRCGRPLKSRKNVKQKQYFYKNRTPLSHLRLWRHDFRTPFRSVIFFKKYRRFDPLAQNRSKTYHSVADVPKKVEKTSSDNTTFANLEHPYRTSGLSAGSFASIVGATCCYLLLAAIFVTIWY